MIELVFTLDYEIYGDGSGALRELIYEPAEKLMSVFEERNARFVVFVEAAELEAIDAAKTDSAVGLVKGQLRELHGRGHEIDLHIHPQWCKARHEGGFWRPDYEEYNLCTLSRDRISRIVAGSIDYLKKVLGDPAFTPRSFRAGNWLLQPTRTVAGVLAEQGIKIDSSVFKGGRQHQHGLDYRRSMKNGYYWRFSEDVNVPDPQGPLLEVPTYTAMVPMWKMFSPKRLSLRQKGPAAPRQKQTRRSRLRDFLRLSYPMKLDFCRLTADQMIHMLEKEIRLDRVNAAVYRPIVAIGHTKDLQDLDSIRSFLSFLAAKEIRIGVLQGVYDHVRPTFMERAGT